MRGARTETARAESERTRSLQGTLIEGSLPAAIVGCDRELKVFAWNAAAESFWGLTSKEVEGKVLSELSLAGGDEIAAMARESAVALAAGRSGAGLTQVTTLADGPPRPRTLRAE